MREVVLRITDKKGVWFRMKVETPSNKNKILGGIGKAARIFPYGDQIPDLVPDASWKVSDEGFIKFRSGKARPRSSTNGDVTTRDLLILGELGARSYDGNDSFGMQLFQFEDVLSVNEKGEGFIIQPWVIAVTPGRIKWAVIG
jgi:hypothetical protein